MHLSTSSRTSATRSDPRHRATCSSTCRTRSTCRATRSTWPTRSTTVSRSSTSRPSAAARRTSSPRTAPFTVPTANQTLPRIPERRSRAPRRTTSVTEVRVAIKDRATSLWYRSNGTWGAFQNQQATLASPGTTSTTWSYVFTPAAGGSGNYPLPGHRRRRCREDRPDEAERAVPAHRRWWRRLTPAFSAPHRRGGWRGAAVPGRRRHGARRHPVRRRLRWQPARDDRRERRAVRGQSASRGVERPAWTWSSTRSDPDGAVGRRHLGQPDRQGAPRPGRSTRQFPAAPASADPALRPGERRDRRLRRRHLQQPDREALPDDGRDPVDRRRRAIGTPFSRPRDVAVGSDGEGVLYVADTDRNRIGAPHARRRLRRVRSDGRHGQRPVPCPAAPSPATGPAASGSPSGHRNRLSARDATAATFIGEDRVVRPTAGDGQFRSRALRVPGRRRPWPSATRSTTGSSGSTGARERGPRRSSPTIGGTKPANGGFNGAFDVAYGPDGSMYAATGSTTGSRSSTRTATSSPRGAATARRTVAHLPARHRGHRRTGRRRHGQREQPDRHLQRRRGPSSPRSSRGPARPACGRTRPRDRPPTAYWVADTGNNRIVHINSAGTVLRSWNSGATVNHPRGIAVDAAGNVYVANGGNTGCGSSRPTGTLPVDRWPRGNGTENGQVRSPYGLRIVGTGANAKLADRRPPGTTGSSHTCSPGPLSPSFGTAGHRQRPVQPAPGGRPEPGRRRPRGGRLREQPALDLDQRLVTRT